MSPNPGAENASITIPITNLQPSSSYGISFSVRVLQNVTYTQPTTSPPAVRKRQQDSGCILSASIGGETILSIPVSQLTSNYTSFSSNPFTSNQTSQPLTYLLTCFNTDVYPVLDLVNITLNYVTIFSSSASPGITTTTLGTTSSTGFFSVTPTTGVSSTLSGVCPARSRRTVTFTSTATITSCPLTCAASSMFSMDASSTITTSMTAPTMSISSSMSSDPCFNTTTSLCFDCALTPEVVLTSYDICHTSISSSSLSTTGGPSGGNGGTGSSGGPGGGTLTVTTTTVFISISVSVSAVPPSTATPNCPDEPAGRVYYSKFGNSYSLYCGTNILDNTVEASHQNDMSGCIQACDAFNILHFYMASQCLGISFRNNMTDLNCELKSTTVNTEPLPGVDSAYLLNPYLGPQNNTDKQPTPVTTVGGPAATGLSCPRDNNTVVVTNNIAFIVECWVQHQGGDLVNQPSYGATLDSCIALCAANPDCVVASFNYPSRSCTQKNTIGPGRNVTDIWAAKQLPAAGPQCPRDAGTYYNTNGKTFLIECYIDHFDNEFARMPIYTESFGVCMDLCGVNEGCVDVSYTPGSPAGPCVLKSGLGAASNQGKIWGGKLVVPEGGGGGNGPGNGPGTGPGTGTGTAGGGGPGTGIPTGPGTGPGIGPGTAPGSGVVTATVTYGTGPGVGTIERTATTVIISTQTVTSTIVSISTAFFTSTVISSVSGSPIISTFTYPVTLTQTTEVVTTRVFTTTPPPLIVTVTVQPTRAPPSSSSFYCLATPTNYISGRAGRKRSLVFVELNELEDQKIDLNVPWYV
ncbi:hypothetical protein K402DRAFT_79718 [Aulographum hederae CBS 113979]|uniref:Apple domain-containing protein n=1 Tax=Aulographum hederae CBS 113979 TaxID=1176131 RepID=A0A6G1HGI0_9PEZI|nr:hypothetical protein K402DRAFT_79718 [Aulographum hederae CBS 113979]